MLNIYEDGGYHPLDLSLSYSTLCISTPCDMNLIKSALEFADIFDNNSVFIRNETEEL